MKMECEKMENLIMVKKIYVDRFSNYVEITLANGEMIMYGADEFVEEVTP